MKEHFSDPKVGPRPISRFSASDEKEKKCRKSQSIKNIFYHSITFAASDVRTRGKMGFDFYRQVLIEAC